MTKNWRTKRNAIENVWIVETATWGRGCAIRRCYPRVQLRALPWPASHWHDVGPHISGPGFVSLNFGN